MPGYDEATVKKSREVPASDDPDRMARRMDGGPSPCAGATESLGIRPDLPIVEKPGSNHRRNHEEHQLPERPRSSSPVSLALTSGQSSRVTL